MSSSTGSGHSPPRGFLGSPMENQSVPKGFLPGLAAAVSSIAPYTVAQRRYNPFKIPTQPLKEPTHTNTLEPFKEPTL